jgi:hypothetical protein
MIITKVLNISLHFHTHAQCSVRHSGACQGLFLLAANAPAWHWSLICI